MMEKHSFYCCPKTNEKLRKERKLPQKKKRIIELMTWRMERFFFQANTLSLSSGLRRCILAAVNETSKLVFCPGSTKQPLPSMCGAFSTG